MTRLTFDRICTLAIVRQCFNDGASIAGEASKARPSGTDSVYTRASNARSAAESRVRFSASRAGVMSASAVTRGKPESRAARAPTSTYRTPCSAKVVTSSRGSIVRHSNASPTEVRAVK